MKLMRYAMMTLLLACCVLPAFAGEVKYQESGFTFWVPDEWTQGFTFSEPDERTQASPVFTAKSPNGELEFVFFAPRKIKSLEDAPEMLDQELSYWLSDIKVGKVQNGEINELSLVSIEATGKAKYEGNPDVAIGVVVYQKENNLFMVICFLPAEALEKYEDAITAIFKQVKHETE